MSAISKITIRLCEFPLTVHYKLSYGTVRNFDTILIEMVNDNGETNIGEATFLPGYGDETSGDCFKASRKIAESILGKDHTEASHLIEENRNAYPFLTTGFQTTIEAFRRKYSNKRIEVPVIGLINEEAEEKIKRDVEELVSNNYEVVKAKVGNLSYEKDLRKIKLIDRYADGALKIRVDANQSLEDRDIRDIVRDFSPVNLELLEQPFGKKNIEKHADLNELAPFPVMLDESIWDFTDIDRVHESSAGEYIKLKLQKCGSLSQFEGMIDHIRRKGIKAIIGNGVQTDINCILEGMVFERCGLAEPAENIGFLKMTERITRNPIEVRDGHMVFVDGPMEVDMDRVKRNVRKNWTAG